MFFYIVIVATYKRVISLRWGLIQAIISSIIMPFYTWITPLILYFLISLINLRLDSAYYSISNNNVPIIALKLNTEIKGLIIIYIILTFTLFYRLVFKNANVSFSKKEKENFKIKDEDIT